MLRKWTKKNPLKIYGIICVLYLSILYIATKSTYYKKMRVFLHMRNNKTDVASVDPKIMNGILRWKARDPPKGSVRDSSVYRKFHEIDNVMGKRKYVKYGQFVAKKNPNNHSKIINHASGKTKLAVWFVSNCRTKSRREGVVDTLTKYIDVEIYGHCGPKKCKKDEMKMNPDKCFRDIEKKYKFYFSFENSLCKNYVSEKLFRAAKYDLVPVVYGVGPYDTIAPPKSYIDVFDFKNLKELADYLLYLDKNDTAYNEYFSWKNDYESISEFKSFKPPPNNKISWCQLCEKLHTDFTPQTYTQMEPFHGPKYHCLKADTPVLKNFIDGT